MSNFEKHTLIFALLLFGILLLSTTFLQAQSETASKLENLIADVTLKEVTYKQSFQRKNEPCTVSIKIINTDKQEEEEYDFNLSDINDYKVKLNATKRSLKVHCESKGGKNVIRLSENGLIEKYTNKFDFFVNDVENGKLIVEELKNQIKSCGEIQNDVSNILGDSPDLNNAISFLKSNIKTVVVNDNTKEQSFTVNEAFKALCSFDITDKEDEKSTKYSFNLSDINSSTINFDTKNEFVFIEVQTIGNRKLIEVFENGEKANYTNNFIFYVENIEEGRKLKEVLKLYAKESEELKSIELARLESLNSLPELNDFFSTKLIDIAVDDVSYSQRFSYEAAKPYLTNINVTNENKGVVEISLVNLIDLNENGISFNTSGSAVEIEMTVNGGMDLVKNTQNAESVKYINEIIVWANTIENARILVETLKKMVQQAKKIYKPNFVEGVDNPTKTQCLEYLNKAFSKVVIGDDAYIQELKQDDTNNCQLVYKEQDVTKDKTYHYKFNMNDINNHKINFNSKGKVAFVYLEVKGQKKFIEISEQGSVSGYNYKMDIKVQDIENARLITEAFKKLSTFCSENTN